MLAAKDSWSSSVTPMFLALRAAHTRVLNIDGVVIVARCNPWKEGQLSFVQMTLRWWLTSTWSFQPDMQGFVHSCGRKKHVRMHREDQSRLWDPE